LLGNIGIHKIFGTPQPGVFVKNSQISSKFFRKISDKVQDFKTPERFRTIARGPDPLATNPIQPSFSPTNKPQNHPKITEKTPHARPWDKTPKTP
jgi:hypothetical protein